MTSFMTEEEINAVKIKLDRKTKENETFLMNIYPKLLTIQLERMQAENRNQATLDNINEMVTNIANKNQDKPKEESWLKQIHEQLNSYKEQMSQQREILMQLEVKYFTEFNALKEEIEEQNNILKDQEKENECKFDEIQREISDKFIDLQQGQIKKFNEINDLKSKMKNHNDILKQYITDNGCKLDKMQRQISGEFVEWKDEQAKHLNAINDLKSQGSHFNETLQKNSENQVKFDDFERQILTKLFELEEQQKLIKSKIKNQTSILKQQDIQIHNEILYIKTQVFKITNGMDVMEKMTPLHMICEYGLKDVDSERFFEEAYINAVNNDGMSPLHLACKYDLKDVAIKLINHGANVNVLNKVGMTPLHFACKNEFYEIHQPLTLGCYSLKYKKDKSHFHFVIKDGNDLSILLELLNHGADINCKDDNGWSALHFASHCGYHIMVRELLKHGADIHWKTNKGSNAVHLAALQGYIPSAFEVCNLKDINCKNKFKDSNPYLTSNGGHLSVVRELISHEADVECKNDVEWSPLHVAAWVGNMPVLKELIIHGTDINCKNKNGENPLHCAARCGQVNIITELLKHGASINCKNVNDDTPLIIAAKNGLVTVITELLKHGADITCKNKQNKTALVLANGFKKAEAIKILNDYETIKEPSVLNFISN